MQEKENGKKKILLIFLLLFLFILFIGLIFGIVVHMNRDGTKENAIPTVNQQAENIEKSIPELEKLGTELEDYVNTLETTVQELQSDLADVNTAIDAVKAKLKGTDDSSVQKLLDELYSLKSMIEGRITDISGFIDALKAKDTALEGKIADLKAYAEGELKNTEDLVDATLNTLEQYSEVQNLITGIENDIGNINKAVADLETGIDQKIKDIDVAVSGLDQSLGDEIKDAVADITDSCKEAVTVAKTDISEAYDDELKEAIADSETSVKDWVPESMANAYDDIADINAKLADLENELADADSERKEELEAQKEALEAAKSELTDAYEKVIEEAVKNNDGVIDDKIAEDLDAAKNALQEVLDEINTEINSIEDKLNTQECETLGHTPGEDDGDCTTEVLCTKCGAVATAGKTEHIWHSDDGDCLTAVTCTVCETVQTQAKDDHSFGGTQRCDKDGHWQVCQNEQCTKSGTKSSHIKGTDGKCTVCGYAVYVAETHTHSYTIDGYDDTHHYKKCACGTIGESTKAAHSAADDHDCTTDDVCSCGFVVRAKQDHVAGEDDGDCTTPVNCRNCDQVAEAGNASHTYSSITYTWTDDYTSCTASGACTTDGCEHTATETVTTTLNGTIYTAVFTNAAFGTKTFDASINIGDVTIKPWEEAPPIDIGEVEEAD